MSGAIQATLDDWEKHVPILLPQYIKELATYRSIVIGLKALSENEREILEEVLRYRNKKVSMDEDDVKFLLAEGMVVVISNYGDGTGLIGCAAPILRTIMLSSIRGPNIVPSSLPTNADHIDPKWLLARTIKNLSIHNIFHEKTFNANNEPSEYSFQAEFLSVFKQLISIAYPSLEYCVLPEVKECDELKEVDVISVWIFSFVIKPCPFMALNSLLQQARQYLIIASNVPNIILPSIIAMKCIQLISVLAKSMPTTSENKITKSFHNQFPNLTKLAELALVGPVSNGIVENVDSDIKFSLTPFIKWT
ncbi:unnamed protein product [Rhizophagus irregularis]|nr:unnamed protein product [Rhizophagus irregularis]CAB5389933.1 unnamed protein product [Rhizophagus irregularis]